MTTKEVWRPLPIYPNHYDISNLGHVRRTDADGTFVPHHLLKKNGTLRVRVYYPHSQIRDKKLDLEVAKAFIPNPNHYKAVLHKDGNPKNCQADNLVWSEYNHTAKKIIQLTPDGKFVKEWPAVKAVTKGGFGTSSVTESLKGKHKLAYGFLWRYK